MLFYSQAVCVSTYFWFCHASFHDCLYTYSCNDSTLQVLSSIVREIDGAHKSARVGSVVVAV